MPQNDFDVANQIASAFRADVNSALQALATLSSGASAPGTTYAYQFWADTATGLLKRRNAANSGWIVVGSLSESFVLTRSSNTVLGAADGRAPRKTIIATANFTQTFDAAATLGDGWEVDYIVDSGATITFDPNSTETIDGATTKVVVGPAQGRIVCNGTLLRTEGMAAATSTQPTRTVYTAGSGTYNTPANATRINVRIIGGGGGGGSAGAGTAGGNTTFGSLTAAGGTAGVTAGQAVGTAAVASGGDYNIPGGTASGTTNAAAFASGSAGGNSVFGGAGGGGPGGAGPLNGGGAATNSGSGGGGGGCTSAASAGTGGNAGAYCEKLIVAPAASYSYGVGAGGAGNGGGVQQSAAGAGAAGIIIIDEYYD